MKTSEIEFFPKIKRKHKFFLRNLHGYSGLQKSIDGHYIRMKWPYFQSLKNIRNTSRKALRLFWLNAKHSEIS